ncbi:hypothetical protein NLJ89_g6868 [Agrocybe chaxingu]|uniref:Uncharacterized protein n=1 Tax=Agrocybe chaxingu TaxID=84603 RepID=A0A9W8MVK9_9AGAR|nr:hypothetical protein NLJ89_g6868 [Agrocybe chaxingu]
MEGASLGLCDYVVQKADVPPITVVKLLNQLECPTSIPTPGQAHELLKKAQDLEKVCRSAKEECRQRLQQAFIDLKQAELQLFEVELYVGRIQCAMPLPQACNAPPQKPSQKSSALPKKGGPTNAPLNQTNRPTTATMVQRGAPTAAGNQENLNAENPGNGRPTRSNRSTRLLQMTKTSEVIGHDLDKINRKRAGKFSEDSEAQDNMLGIPENPMAPPAAKRHRATKKVHSLACNILTLLSDLTPLQLQGASSSVIPADPPLQKTAPKPVQSRPPSGIYPRPQDPSDRPNNVQSRQVQPMLSQWDHCLDRMDQDDVRDGTSSTSILPLASTVIISTLSQTQHDEDSAYEPDGEEEGGDGGSGDMGYEEGSQQVDDFYQASDDDCQIPRRANNASGRAVAQPALQDDRNPFREQYYPGGIYDTSEQVEDIAMDQIDERSPSEDEQNALAMIRQRRSEAPDDAAVAGDLDVLEEHRKKNRPNRAPQPARLEAAAEYQQRVQDVAQDFMAQDEREESSDEEEEDPSCSEESPHTRAARNSRFNGEIKPTTLGYYHALL